MKFLKGLAEVIHEPYRVVNGIRVRKIVKFRTNF